MMNDLMVHAVVAVWWSFAVLVFLRMDADNWSYTKTSQLLAISVFWPLFVPMGLVAALWRIPFKTTHAIRVDLKNRGILKDFEDFMRKRAESSDA